MKNIDMTGKPCPMPVVEAKKALSAPGSTGAVVLVDNRIAVQNLEKMARGMQYAFAQRELAPDLFEVTLTVGDAQTAPEKGTEAAGAAEKGASASTSPYAVLITAQEMGRGSAELGAILLKGYLYALSESETPPHWVVFVNGGAHLTAEGSNTVPDLLRLAERGCDIMTCGTCSNYYALQEKLAVGRIVTMYDIAGILARADRVVSL